MVFEQDLAFVDSAKHTSEYFMEEGIVEVDWAPRSPDIKPIENIWWVLVCAVYSRGRQFDREEDIQECLIYERKNLIMDVVRTAIASMIRRVWELYKRNGHHTKY